MSEKEPGRCRSCGAAVTWAETIHGKRMPVDVEAVANGNIILSMRVDDVPLAIYTSKDQLSLEDVDVPHYVSHFATCKDAPKWRRK